MRNSPHSYAVIVDLLDRHLDVEFTFIRTEEVSAVLAAMPREQQDFILEWTRRAGATNPELAFQFANRAKEALGELEQEVVAAWCLHAMDSYDSAGLQAAMSVIRNLEGFLETGHQRRHAAVFDEVAPVLSPFVHGLEGRRLRLHQDDFAWTDGENIYLPEAVAHFDSREANFLVLKATATHLWAQTRYGTLNRNLAELFAAYEDAERARACFQALEGLRLDARIGTELPGLHRRMSELGQRLGEAPLAGDWKSAARSLAGAGATLDDSLAWLHQLYGQDEPIPQRLHHGQLRPAEAWQARLDRIERDKAHLRELLRVVANEIGEARDERAPPDAFELRDDEDADEEALLQVEIALQDQPLAVPEMVRERLSSILLDLGEIPPEYLTPAGEGEYDPAIFRDEERSADDAWAGAYHEEGAFLYNEWDHARQAHKKNWCVLREVELKRADTAFYRATLDRYAGHVRSLRRTFEILRGEDKLLKRRKEGDDIDIDALVEAWGDVHHGLEMSDRIFARMHREERNIAVMFMVDMSGSTRGWINEAEREALILLAESLETLGDRYAIYGFSGWTRKRCEAYRVKDFDDDWSDEVIGRVCAIEPRDYTRMGAPIRHLAGKLKDVEARTKLLVTLSDGKPDDYDLEYRGDYAIEDTRQALYEARRDGIHSYCITIDREGQDYLPHMYGAANYVVLDDIAQLPLRVSDIYRRITT